MKLIAVLFALVVVASAQYPYSGARSTHGHRQLRKSMAQSYGPRAYGMNRAGFDVPSDNDISPRSLPKTDKKSSALSTITGAISAAVTAIVPVVRGIMAQFTDKLQGTPFGRPANLILTIFDLIAGTAQCVVQQISGY